MNQYRYHWNQFKALPRISSIQRFCMYSQVIANFAFFLHPLLDQPKCIFEMSGKAISVRRSELQKDGSLVVTMSDFFE